MMRDMTTPRALDASRTRYSAGLRLPRTHNAKLAHARDHPPHATSYTSGFAEEDIRHHAATHERLLLSVSQAPERLVLSNPGKKQRQRNCKRRCAQHQVARESMSHEPYARLNRSVWIRFGGTPISPTDFSTAWIINGGPQM